MSRTPSIPMRVAAGRWVRHAFLRENLVGALKTFAWLGPLTLVIWVYAERAQVVPVDNITVPIEIQSADANRYVSLAPGSDRSVTVKLSGARSRIEQIRQSVRPQPNGRPSVILTIDSRLGLGNKDIDAAAAIGDSTIFRNSGVSVTDARPALLRIYIDPLEEREYDVQVPQGVQNLETAPVFVPAKVKVRAPETYFERMGPIEVEADLANMEVIHRPGPHPDQSIRVRSPQLAGQDGVTYTPETVKADLNVRQADVPTTLPTVLVSVEALPGILQKYDVQFAEGPTPRLFSVKVIGPADKIEQLSADGAVPPAAVLEVTADDLPKADGSERPPKPLSFRHFTDLGIRLDGPPPTIKFKLVPRATDP